MASWLHVWALAVIRRLGAGPFSRLPETCSEGPRPRPAYSPGLLAIFLQSLLRHGLHELRIGHGHFVWDSHRDGVRIKELQNHLSEARGHAGVRRVGSHLEGGKVREGLKPGQAVSHFATKIRLTSGPWIPLLFSNLNVCTTH